MAQIYNNKLYIPINLKFLFERATCEEILHIASHARVLLMWSTVYNK